MVYIILLAAYEKYPAVSIAVTASIITGFLFLYFKRVDLKGTDSNLMVLLSFSVSGLGLVYIGANKEGLIWFIIQNIGVLTGYILYKIGVHGHAVGLSIMLPFLFQLCYCAKEYRERFGNNSVK